MTNPRFNRLVRIKVLLLSFLCVPACSVTQDEVSLRGGERFVITGELYAYGVADDLNDRKVSIISLVPLHISGPEIVSRQLVPPGTILTIVDRAPKRFPSFLYPDRYLVRLNGLSLPAEVPVVMGLYRGIEGTETPLNPLIFKPMP